MILFDINTDILADFKHTSQGTDKEHDESDVRAQRML